VFKPNYGTKHTYLRAMLTEEKRCAQQKNRKTKLILKIPLTLSRKLRAKPLGRSYENQQVLK